MEFPFSRNANSIAKLLKRTSAKVLLVLQAALLTPLPHLSADVTSITIEVQKPMDEMWSDFDSSYEGLVLLVERLERLAHDLQIDENINPQALNELKLLVIRLAQYGGAASSLEDSNALYRDIIDLLIDEEGEDPCNLWLNADQFLDGSACTTLWSDDYFQQLPCDFWKSAKKAIKRCAHKVEKFIRHHKEEILIGAGVVVVVGAVTYAVSACVAKGAAAAASAAAAALSPDDDKEASENKASSSTTSSECPSKEAQIIEQVSHLKDALNVDQAIAATKGIINNNPLDPEFADYVKNASAKIAHDIWREIGKTGALALEVEEEVQKIGTAILPEEIIALMRQEGQKLASIDQTQENWKSHIANGHQKIDEWFNQSIPYDDHLQSQLEEKFATGTPPFPIGNNQKLMDDVKKTSQVANLVRSSQEGTTIAEEVAVMNRPQYALAEKSSVENKIASAAQRVTVSEGGGIRILEDDIWAIEGCNIKKFNMRKFIKEKVHHIFNKERHQLDRFSCSNEVIIDRITRSIIEADRAGKIPLNQDFTVRLIVDGLEVEVRGIVLDGELKYGTFFIPEGK